MTLRKKIGRNDAYTPSESQIVNLCLRWLWAHGCFVWRNNTGAYKPEGGDRYIRYGTPGSADIIGLTKSGRMLAVECKTGKNKMSPLQEVFKQHIQDHNGIFICAYGIEYLERHKEEILSTYYPPAHAEGYNPDYRVKPSSARQCAIDEVLG